jgi:transcriptional regulator with XRE-family HTH domain
MPEYDPQAHSELASFGEELRREREIRGISLKEIADATKISKRFLEAIERNDHKTLPAPVFTRGFVREYARYLGLNADEMVSRYNYAAAGDDRIEQSQHLERLVQVQSPAKVRKGIPPPYARIDRNVIILVLIVAALAGAFYWALQHRQASNTVEAEVAPPAPKPVLAATPKTESQPEAEPEMLKLQIDADEDSWVVLDADGKNVLNERLRRGDHRAVEAKDAFLFRTIGNAGGVTLTLNDVRLPPVGRDGQVVHDRVVDRQTLEQARSST